MPTCVVCENVQAAGAECDVCGRPFPAGEARPVPVEPLEGLEATLRPPADAVPDPMPDLEPTSTAAVEVTVASIEGLEPTEAEGIPDDPPSPGGSAAACRYCGEAAPLGEIFCARCGMRLPIGDALPPGETPELVLCRDCSVPVRGSSCPSCGARVR
jgi:hypothetical protein